MEDIPTIKQWELSERERVYCECETSSETCIVCRVVQFLERNPNHTDTELVRGFYGASATRLAAIRSKYNRERRQLG